MTKKKLSAAAVAGALFASGAVFAQGPSVPSTGPGAGSGTAPGAPGATAPDAVTQPGPVESVTREEFRGDPFSLSAPAANPFGSVQSGVPFGIPSAESGAAGLRLGPGTLYPALGLNLRHDDNIFFSDANKRSSFISVLTPIVRYEMRSRNAIYDLIYKGDYANYWDSSADNYDDHQAIARASFGISSRANARVSAEYFRSHDPRGSTDRVATNQPDVFDAKSINGLFAYGATGAQGRFEVEGGFLEKRYKNNRAVTIFADRDTTFGAGTFYWRVMPKTSLLFQVRGTDIDYKQNTTRLDSSELRFLTGVTWEATAKTTGTFRIGQVRKDFDDATRQDFTGIGWEGTVSWSPLTYSTITFSSAREPTESSGTGDFILSQIYYLTWSHAWTERITSAVSAGYRQDEFRGAAATREDDTANAGFRLTYRMRRWLSLSGEYTYTDRQSNAPFVEYSRNLFMLSLGATL